MPRNILSWLRKWKLRDLCSTPFAEAQGGIRRLLLEELESRIVPATRVWDGGGATALWSNPQNWTGDVAPQAGRQGRRRQGSQHRRCEAYSDAAVALPRTAADRR